MHEYEEKEVAKTEEALKDICELEERLTKMLSSCKYELDSDDGFKIVDMIKDLSEAKEKCWKSLYYKTLIETMKNSHSMERYDYDEEMPMGYNNRRYSSGRYAPAGKGHMSGYTPNMMPSYEVFPNHQDMIRGFAYDDRKSDSERMYPYDMYRDAKRHYTETRSDEDKSLMDARAEETIKNLISNAKEIWKDADPTFRKNMKNEFTKLLGDMSVI